MRAKSRGRRRLSRTNEVGEKKRAQKTAKKNSFSSFFFFLCLSLSLSQCLSFLTFVNGVAVRPEPRRRHPQQHRRAQLGLPEVVLPEGGPPRLEVCRVGRLGGGQRRGEAPAPAVVCEPASLFSLLVLLVGAVPGVGGDREGVAGGEAETDLVKGGPFEVCFFFSNFIKKSGGKKVSERAARKERERKRRK